MSSWIDLRSDTVTRPTPAMRRAMADAEVGDDVLGDDPTVLRLQERVAAIMGKEAALFVPSGAMANQISIRTHCEPGDEVICSAESHIVNYETGAPAALSGVMLRFAQGDRGMFDADQVHALTRPDSSHFPHSRLVVVENTQNRGGGAVWALDRIRRVCAAAREHGLKLHLDGARIWNASIASGVSPAEFARDFDTVSCCFSKGLGAPVGSAVSGDRATIARVHRFRKMFGGGMRQAGILAAAALYALDHHVDRLADDHANARRLAEGIADVPGLSVPMPVDSNMVFIDVPAGAMTAADFCARARERGVLMLPTAPQRVRAVCHLDVTRDMIDRAVRAIASIVGAPATV